MKSILISIKPERVAKILSGEKIIEIRKTAPKCDLPIDVYIYCTKDGYLHLENEGYWSYSRNQKYTYKRHGKVVAKFTLREIEKFDFISEIKYKDDTLKYNEEIRKHNRICKEAGVSATDIVCYLDTKCLGSDNPSGMVCYAWRISDLVIFDKPKELSEFKHPFLICRRYCDNNFVPSFCRLHCSHNTDPERLDVCCDRNDKWRKPITKAPQSWCYVEVKQ